MAQVRGDDVTIAGAKLGRYRHVCAFFRDPEEEYQTLLPFIKEGIDQGEKALHIVDPVLVHHHRLRLESTGMDTAELERSKQLEVRGWEQAYLRSQGGFDLNDMLSLIEEMLKSGKSEGFPLTRIIGHVEWSLEDRPGVNDLIEYETRLNTILPDYQDPVICVYDLTQCGAGIVIDGLRTHPMVIVGGILHENPFYAPPEEFLRELQSRQSSQ